MADNWLLADVGGTNTRVGLADRSGLIPTSVRNFPNSDFACLEDMLSAYCSDQEVNKINALCAGVAGPVKDGTAQLTNHHWFIDAGEISQKLGVEFVILINDLQAQAYALDDLDETQLTLLFPGASPPQNQTRLVMGLGTGSNIAVAHCDGARLLVPPSETGHTSLPHCEGKLGDLISFLASQTPHTPLEAALSGPGLQNIWSWLGGSHENNPAEILQSESTRAEETIALFCQLLGKVAGNIALSHLPMGGFYFIGSAARAIAPHLANSLFYEEFVAKGPYSHIMREIPIHLITDDSAALRGCRRCLIQALERC